MNLYTFLASLPAIMGLTGFVAYQVLRRGRLGSEVTKRIVGKLRQRRPEVHSRYAELSPSQLRVLLRADHQLSELVSAQDAHLLRLALRQSFIESLTVYVLTGALFVFGVIMFVDSATSPPPLELTKFHLESTVPEAEGLAVDLDPLRLTWTSTGEPTDLECLLENVQTGRRSNTIKTSSSQGSVVFVPDGYEDLLEDRTRGHVNRIRAICRTSAATFQSEEFALQVGIKIVAFYDPSRQELLVTALVDNSSIPHYFYEARVLLFRKGGGSADVVSYGDSMQTPSTKFHIANPREIDWRQTRIVYFGPDDDRVVRTEPLVSDLSPAIRVEP